MTGSLRKNFSHLLQYLAEFFLEWEMFHIKVVEKVKTHILCSTTFFRIPCRLRDNVEKYGGAKEAEKEYGAWMLHAAQTKLYVHT